MFYPIKSQRSCHVQHCTCYQNLAMYSIFIIKEFQAAFWTRYCSVIHCISQGEIVYSVRLHCAERALKHKCFIRLNRSDPAIYSTVHATSTLAMYSMFYIKEFQAAFRTRYCSVIHCIWHGEFVYSVRLHCVKRALKHKCFIRFNRSDPAMYITVPATKISPWIQFSL